MLVENAVKHGIEPLRAGGQVALAAREHAGGLQFVVANDKADPLAGGSVGEGLGIGIRNIEQRLALLYGTATTHEVRDGNGRYEVVLTIPMEPAP
jgi:sensor histidine kinase YesM